MTQLWPEDADFHENQLRQSKSAFIYQTARICAVVPADAVIYFAAKTSFWQVEITLRCQQTLHPWNNRCAVKFDTAHQGAMGDGAC
jgi:hypothetical protein